MKNVSPQLLQMLRLIFMSVHSPLSLLSSPRTGRAYNPSVIKGSVDAKPRLIGSNPAP